ncbi:uncharacterized protein LOC143600894 [Bidens hawaiensis]|uniref:uncharacterized protein LOC143600894 n=1 Tax=Bidens hawaiensis TaxID=980011 RepID=UPI00404969E7
MANKSVIMASSFTGEPFEPVYVDVSDSDSWQVIDPSDSDIGEDFSFDENEDGSSDSDDVLQQRFGSPSSDISVQSLADEINHHFQELQNAYEIDHNRETIDDVTVMKDGEDDPYESEADEEGGEEEEEDNLGLDLDLDDELVPKWLNNKFERQRMRKLGKKVYPKMKKSKRLVCQYNKPGCVHGKHGLGMKHNLIW